MTEDIARAVLSKADSERRSIGKAAEEFLERVLGETTQAHYHFQRRAD